MWTAPRAYAWPLADCRPQVTRHTHDRQPPTPPPTDSGALHSPPAASRPTAPQTRPTYNTARKWALDEMRAATLYPHAMPSPFRPPHTPPPTPPHPPSPPTPPHFSTSAGPPPRRTTSAQSHSATQSRRTTDAVAEHNHETTSAAQHRTWPLDLRRRLKETPQQAPGRTRNRYARTLHPRVPPAGRRGRRNHHAPTRPIYSGECTPPSVGVYHRVGTTRDPPPPRAKDHLRAALRLTPGESGPTHRRPAHR